MDSDKRCLCARLEYVFCYYSRQVLFAYIYYRLDYSKDNSPKRRVSDNMNQLFAVTAYFVIDNQYGQIIGKLAGNRYAIILLKVKIECKDLHFDDF